MFALESDDYAKFRDIVQHASFAFCPNQSFFQGAGSGYNMLSGKTMYYNAIKTDSIKAESCVTLANGSATPSTVLGRIFIFCHTNWSPTIVPRHLVHKYFLSVIIFCLWQNIKLCKKFPGLKSRNVIMRISKLPRLMRIRKMKSVSTAKLTMRKVTKRKCHRKALRIVIRRARSLSLQKKHPARPFQRLLKWTTSRTRKYSWEKAHWPPSVHPQQRWTHPNIKIESVL